MLAGLHTQNIFSLGNGLENMLGIKLQNGFDLLVGAINVSFVTHRK